MSNLNWRCCAKNLKRYKKDKYLLIRFKLPFYHSDYYLGMFYPKMQFKPCYTARYHQGIKELFYDDSLTGSQELVGSLWHLFEYVTLGEL